VCMSCLTLSSRPCSFNILCACLVSLCHPDRVPSVFCVHVLSLWAESFGLQFNIVNYFHYFSPSIWPVGCTGICVGRTNHIPMEYETKDRLRAAAQWLPDSSHADTCHQPSLHFIQQKNIPSQRRVVRHFFACLSEWNFCFEQSDASHCLHDNG